MLFVMNAAARQVWLAGAIYVLLLTVSPAPAKETWKDWELATDSTPKVWYDHASVAFGGKMWVFDRDGTVWHSTDGARWLQAIHRAPWHGVYDHTAVVHDDGMWVLGSYPDEVWFSRDGATWLLKKAAAGWGARQGHASTLHDGDMWVLGGLGRNDVWRSPNGITWTDLGAHANWGGRSDHTALSFDGALWVIGGTSEFCDVWRSPDGGVTWTNTAIFTSPSFKPKDHTSAVIGGRMYVIGGQGVSGGIWCSSNGADWQQVIPAAPLAGRYDHTTVVFDRKVWVIGGYGKSDVWYSEILQTMGPEPEWTKGTANTVSWTMLEGATDYELQCALNDDFTSSCVTATVAPPTLSHEFVSLNDGRKYWYRVRAHGPTGPLSEWSESVWSIQDASTPAVVVSTGAPNPTRHAPIPFAVEFSEPVTGFDQTDVAVSGGRILGLTGSGESYAVSVQPVGEGAVAVRVPADVAQDDAGQGNTASNQVALVFDSVEPVFELDAVVPAAARLGTSVTISMTASEALASIPVVTVDGLPVACVATSTQTFVCDFVVSTPNVERMAEINISGTDLAGNSGALRDTTSLRIDSKAPVISELSADPVWARDGTPVRITFRVSEPTLTTPTVTLNARSADLLHTDGEQFEYGYTISPVDPDGGASVDVSATDLIGNTGHASLTGQPIVDKIIPWLVDIKTTPSQAREGQQVQISFTATDDLSSSSTVTVNGHGAALNDVTGLRYSYHYVTQSSDPEGTGTVEMVAVDLAGNMSPLTTDSLLIDKTAPVSEITGPAGLATTTALTLSFTVDDPGPAPSGVASIDVYWSRDAGPYALLGTFSDLASDIPFHCEAHGGNGTYAFYSVAVDAVGNRELPPVGHDALVSVDVLFDQFDVNHDGTVNVADVVYLINYMNGGD